MPVHQHSRVIVVGGGLAAARTCQALRRRGFDGTITLLTDERILPYDRPPLSKDVLAGKRDDTALKIDFADLDVHVVHGAAAQTLDMDRRVVTTSAGDFDYGGLVIATGAHPIRVPGDGEQLTLRTLQDAIALRQRLTPGTRVVLIGASWIGAEVATAALAHGCTVSCVEAGPAPLAQALGEQVGKRLLSWWSGIDLRLGTSVEQVSDGGVLLSDGCSLAADVVVTGVGVRPSAGWLDGSRIQLDRGVVVDERLIAAPDVVAVGDVAAWWSRTWNQRMRIEHWDDAASGPATAAASLLYPDAPDGPIHDPVPYFWSDQFGNKLQYVGAHGAEDSLVWRDHGADRWTAAWVAPDGRLTAALVTNLPREMVQARKAIADGLCPAPELLQDPAVSIADSSR